MYEQVAKFGFVFCKSCGSRRSAPKTVYTMIRCDVMELATCLRNAFLLRSNWAIRGFNAMVAEVFVVILVFH